MKTNAGCAPYVVLGDAALGSQPMTESFAIEKYRLDPVSWLKLRNDEDWNELGELFRGKLSLSDGLALLHRSFRCPHNQDSLPKMIYFMLSFADRYYDDARAKRNDSEPMYFTYRGFLRDSEIRKELRLKAFMVLCESFFKAICSGEMPRSILFHSDVFEKLIWFFRPHQRGCINSNILPVDDAGLGKDGGKHYLDLAQKFAREFCIWSWDFAQSIQYCKRSYSDEETARILAMCEQYRLEIFDLMDRLGSAHLFKSPQYLPSPQSCRSLIERYLIASDYPDLLTAHRDGKDDRAGILLLMEDRVLHS